MTHRSRLLVASLAGVFVLVLVCAGGPMLAQSRMERATAAAGAQGDTRSPESPNAPAAEKPAATAMPTDPGSAVLGDPATRQRYLDAMQRYYEYRANGYAYRSRVFEWQLFSSRVIFLIVLVLVGAGIYFAAVQFRGAMRAAARPATAVELSPLVPGVTLATQLEVSAKGIVVNSSVMGVIILALSLAFFYLYLVYVYPITDVL
jgi:hypothetical protein